LPECSEYNQRASGEGSTYEIKRKCSDFENEEAQQQWAVETLNGYVIVLRPWSERMVNEAKD
jgi:hypothetical protein